ncbi:hypothetical protein CSUI_006211 [Cystoisospora suis]|uniref:Complex 1 LYR protein domain-containing protein n=1 Tax=Cystoisospora suis TaxID=483139 RepID=A0A2C6KUW1_9APIC|nr:hypothetical protein CSUI_006211 [Cystoisospora suis]
MPPLETMSAPSFTKPPLFLYEQLQLRLGESLKLYRDVLRLHRRQLPAGPTRELADRFARAEFRTHMAAASEASQQAAATEALHMDSNDPYGCTSSSAGVSYFSPLPGGPTSGRGLPTGRGNNVSSGRIALLQGGPETPDVGRRDQTSHLRGVSPQLRAVTFQACEQLRRFNEAWQDYLRFARDRELRHGRHMRPTQRGLLSESQRQQLQAIKDLVVELRKQPDQSFND